MAPVSRLATDLRGSRLRPRRPLLVGIGVSIVLPAVVEIVQYLAVSGRATTVEDWFLGAVGGVAASVAAATLGTRRLSPRDVEPAIADPSR
jgi:ABC-type Fe3+-siderophore transport system permease subunit